MKWITLHHRNSDFSYINLVKMYIQHRADLLLALTNQHKWNYCNLKIIICALKTEVKLIFDSGLQFICSVWIQFSPMSLGGLLMSAFLFSFVFFIFLSLFSAFFLPLAAISSPRVHTLRRWQSSTNSLRGWDQEERFSLLLRNKGKW